MRISDFSSPSSVVRPPSFLTTIDYSLTAGDYRLTKAAQNKLDTSGIGRRLMAG